MIFPYNAIMLWLQLRLFLLTKASTKESSANEQSSTKFQVVIFEFQVWIRICSPNGKATIELLDRVSISENSIPEEILRQEKFERK